ncbi:sugar phosphate isomerase/epimerase [uncultured Vibrio sp.]|uniref:sugar phosphate isomerase/epimerase family protein n=1 Tax=uncultured Vibrio sp. TaxID=114054 RepID=UPI00262323CE|nr:TIM barrel protein [uncultured Vibrio sp.]
MNPRVGIVEWGLSESGPKAIEMVREYGLSCIQLNFTRDYEIKNYRRKILSTSRSTGVSIAAIALNILNEYQLSGISSNNFKQSHIIFGAALRAAVDLEVNHIFIPSFYTGEVSSPKDIIRLSLFYKWACSLALESQVVVSTENTLSIECALELYRLVDRPNFQFIFDPYNYLVSNINPINIYDRLGDIFNKQIHVKNGDGKKGGVRPLDDDLFDLQEVLVRIGRQSTFYLENKYHIIGLENIKHDFDWLVGILHK